MNSAKVFALSLLLVCPFTLARVQFDAHFELKNSPHYGNRILDTQVQLDENNKSAEVYSSEDFKIVAELLSEQENNATACYTIYAKNDLGEFEKIMDPVLVPNYTEEALLGMGSTDGDSFTMTLKAQKV